jgi:hypothetical protein
MLRGTAVGIREGREMLWKIFCDLELEGKYFGNEEWEGKYFVIQCWKENIFEIRVRRKIFWIQSWKEIILVVESANEIVANLSSFTWRKSHIFSMRSRDVSTVSHVF